MFGTPRDVIASLTLIAPYALENEEQLRLEAYIDGTGVIDPIRTRPNVATARKF